MKELPYYEQIDRKNIQKLRIMIQKLPLFCSAFFRGIEPFTSSRTRIAYAYDLKIFFDFLQKNNPVIENLEIKDITLSHLDELSVTDIEEYMEYVRYRYKEKQKEERRHEQRIRRKNK